MLSGIRELKSEANGFRFLPYELTALVEEIAKGKVHSSQLSQRAKNRHEFFELRKIENATISIQNLSVYKKMNDKFISFRFIIPAFQRGYRWETEQVRDLLDDIYCNYKKYYNYPLPNESESYCIQPLVLKKSNNFLNEYVVIDGQQRLTTLALFLEALNNQVPEDTECQRSHIPIFYESRKACEEFLYGIADKCRVAIQQILENYKTPATPEEKAERTRDIIDGSPNDLDSRYILNTYLYAYWYFWEKINAKGNDKNYFDFAEKEWNKDEQWEPKRFTLFENMLLEQTSIIWYQIDNDEEDEHKIFEDFNSGKISLTGSELVKGIFMNPDNYMESYDEKNSSMYEQLKIKQTMLGGQWDDIEKVLHNDEFWHFIPHQNDREDEKSKSTRIDSIFDMYVYFNIMGEREAFNSEDYLFSFRKINGWVTAQLNKSQNKFKTMWELWLEIKNVYTTFYGWFVGDDSLKNVNSLYHRISLLKRIIINIQSNYTDRYLTELRHTKSLYKSLITCIKSERVNFLNAKILKVLLDEEDFQQENIKICVNTMTYGNANKAEGMLLAFNLNTLESAKAYGGRFPFDIFDREKWHKEHIFATNTELSSEDNNENDLLDALVSESELRSFENYLKLTNQPKSASYEQTINDINLLKGGQIFDDEKNILRNKLLGKDGDILKNILRDNYMGNMALLTQPDNISISNYSYNDKANKIKRWFRDGDFIPICTMNVFNDFYSDHKSYDIHWLYEKRLSYLKQMADSVSNYLGCESEAQNV
jgi:hypothetical protein